MVFSGCEIKFLPRNKEENPFYQAEIEILEGMKKRSSKPFLELFLYFFGLQGSRRSAAKDLPEAVGPLHR